jgi:hypothetical protein
LDTNLYPWTLIVFDECFLKLIKKWNIELLWHLFHADTYILPSTLLTSLSFVYFFWYHYHEESI